MRPPNGTYTVLLASTSAPRSFCVFALKPL